MSGSRGLPSTAVPPRTPGLPESASFHLLSDFAGLNTRVDRASIEDQQMAWSDNLMPIGKGQLRALYDVGLPIYSIGDGREIIAHGWFILSDATPSCMVFLTDGSAVKVTQAGTITAVAPAGTFSPVSGTVPAFCQYGNQYVAIVCSQTNGYFLYDGTYLYQAGTISPSAPLTDGGNAYTSPPTITVKTTGSGTGATFAATVADGAVILLTPTNPGSGYAVGDLVWPLFGGGGAGTSPLAHATIGNGVITSATLTSGGSGWQNSSGVQEPPDVTITDATGTGASISVSGIAGGVVTALEVVDGGQNYSAPTLTFSGSAGGTSPIALAYTSDGVVIGTTIDSAGSGLVGEVTAQMLDPNGTGAAFTVTTNGGAVSAITINGGGLQGGSGYSQTPIVFSGGGIASATLSLMPSQVNGTSIETYQNRIWITGGSGIGSNQNSLTFFTAPDSTTDFSAADGGGVFPSTDSFLKNQYTGVKQALGYLYLLGDSSSNYISGVQTTGTPPTTTFSNLNIDPTIGTVWQESLIVFGTTVMFANIYGVHAIIGGSIRKVSEPMDGLFYTAPPPSSTFRPSSALHTLYGKQVYCFCYKINNPYTGDTTNTIMCWDGNRWWTYSPTPQIISLSTLETQSNITAWGTDGTHIYPLFTIPEAIPKTLKTKLYTAPSLILQKRAWGVYVLFGAYATTGAVDLAGYIDLDGNTSVPLTFDTLQGAPSEGPQPTILWAKSAGAQGSGYAMGLTLTSTSTDFALYQAMLVAQDYVTRT